MIDRYSVKLFTDIDLPYADYVIPIRTLLASLVFACDSVDDFYRIHLFLPILHPTALQSR